MSRDDVQARTDDGVEIIAFSGYSPIFHVAMLVAAATVYVTMRGTSSVTQAIAIGMALVTVGHAAAMLRRRDRRVVLSCEGVTLVDGGRERGSCGWDDVADVRMSPSGSHVQFLDAAGGRLLCVTVDWIGRTSKLREIEAASVRLRGLCGSCGYNLTGNVSGACPECGNESGANDR